MILNLRDKITKKPKTFLADVLKGGLQGFQIWIAIDILTGGIFHSFIGLVLLFIICGAVLGIGRGRILLWFINGSLFFVIGFMSLTSITHLMLRAIERRDLPQRMPAVVVLSPDGGINNGVSSVMQARLLTAYQLLRSGMAQRLVLTRVDPSFLSSYQFIRRQMEEYHLEYPVDTVGPVRNTHDEAIAVAHLARQHHWVGVLLVSQGWHLRRAGAVFETAGVRVVCFPSLDWSMGNANPIDQSSRFKSLSYWVHEYLGYKIYQRRGWIR